MYFNLCRICNVENFAVLKKVKVIKSGVRWYQSDNVFGYRKKPTSQYKVSDKILQNRSDLSNFYRLVTAYRTHGHKYANINPVSFAETVGDAYELNIGRYGFKGLNDTVNLKDGIISLPNKEITLEEAIAFLNSLYCNHLTAEFEYLETEEEREWFSLEFESLSKEEIDKSAKISLLKDLIRAQAFDNFLAKKFSSVKRYGGEGAESMIGFFNEIFQFAAKDEAAPEAAPEAGLPDNDVIIIEDTLEQIVFGMPHRGRLNLLTGLLNYPPSLIFHKLKGNANIPEKYKCSGDVVTHVISSTNLTYNDSESIHVTLLFNPSHLEAVNPVSMGKTRAKQMMSKDGAYGDSTSWSNKILNIQVHGDAALPGQGVNQECLELSGVPHFEIGGSIHLAVNNQLGFTTPSDRGRSSRYCTDLAKAISAPVIHVNGDYPEEVLKAARLAYNYQRKFRKDVFIDLNCFRRWGHNEMDDPTFTNPALYAIVNSRRSVPDLYAERLVKDCIISEHECSEVYDEHFDWLNEELIAAENYTPQDIYFKSQWEGISQADDAVTVWDTGIDVDLMTFLGEKSVKYPDNFKIHPTVLRGHVKNRLSRIAEGLTIDWSTAEALAIGSLLFEGHNVRISGQDVGRGTFSQRHGMLVDQETNNIHIPLNNIHPKQTGFLELANSILSEEAVIAYEYGMSIEHPNNLNIWEAQFGDFFNGAQIIFDTFISSAEAKWIYQSGLTVLLPHGFDGVGPEHSSSRIERFLQLTDSKEDAVDGDDINMQVCQPSTPAQYFHLLRRQIVRNFRKPLIIITPKTLLRAPECISKFGDMAKGTHFKPVIGDTKIEPSTVKRVLLTSGKHYYSLAKERESIGVDDAAIIRIESYCPFPTAELLQEISQYSNARVFIWCQEEPQNMGAWSFFKRRFENLIGKAVKYCGRPTSSAPAVGVGKIHKQQEAELLTKPFLM